MTRDAQSRGYAGERLVQDYLEKKGYLFVAANWKQKVGEIDLIMQDGSTLVFVEVRLRRPTSFGTGVETVAWQKQRKLIRTAQWYLQATKWAGAARFDVVSVTAFESTEPQIDHIQHAFEV